MKGYWAHCTSHECSKRKHVWVMPTQTWSTRRIAHSRQLVHVHIAYSYIFMVSDEPKPQRRSPKPLRSKP